MNIFKIYFLHFLSKVNGHSTL